MKGEKGGKRKQELLQIAYRLFLTKGYEETSVDEIIAEAKIAKGTFYYHFESKGALLEALTSKMISEKAEQARMILSAPLSVPQKAVAVITTFRPDIPEMGLQDALHQKENILAHEKINKSLIDEAVPILSEVVAEGIEQGILNCDNIPQRVRMTLVISSSTFDEGNYTDADIDVFVDTVEKLLGAKNGTFEFIRQLIQ